MQVTLIGMSGIGKSYWSRRLREKGFRLFDCDAEIADLLDSKLQGEGDVIERLAAWMGFPYEPGYAAREAEYLALENEVTARALVLLQGAQESGEHVLIDCTGSVIYVQPGLLADLTAASIVAHLAAPESVQERMRRDYFAHPRPILWRDHFVQETGETGEEALAKSYPRLLASREERYRELADVAFQPDELRDEDFDAERFLARLRASLPKETRP